MARIDASKWAISARGFNGRFTNSLLVQIDGRTVYTPLFGGVFWDVQDTLLEDVERIEIIRGPGATVLGSQRGQWDYQYYYEERQRHSGRLRAGWRGHRRARVC